MRAKKLYLLCSELIRLNENSPLAGRETYGLFVQALVQGEPFDYIK